MAEHSSDSTSPADHLIRTTEMEAVVMDLRKKIKDIETPGGPDLTEVKASINRLYKIVLTGSGTGGGGWTSDPQSETYFDDPGRQRSLFSVVLGADGYGAYWTQFMTVTTSTSVMRLTYGNDSNIAQWLSTNGKSLSTVTVGSTDVLDALGGKSLAEKLGSVEMISAVGTKSVIELVFGSAARAANWVTSLKSLAEGVYGDAKPNITHDPIIMRIARIESRLSAGGL